MSLHSDIMNIPFHATMSHYLSKDELIACKEGHKHARHAAAEMALALEAENAALREELAKAKQDADRYRTARDMLSKKHFPVEFLRCKSAKNVDIFFDTAMQVAG